MTDYSALLDPITEISDEFYQRLIGLWAVAFTSSLMDLSNTVRSNDQQFSAIRVAREVQGKQVALGEAFALLCRQRLERFFAGKLQADAGDDMQAAAGGLSLMSAEQLDRNLTISSLTRRVETRCSEQYFTLNQRLAVVRGGRKLSERENPFSAVYCGETLCEALAELELSSRHMTLALRCFERVLLDNCTAFLQRLNRCLIEHGVLPNLRYSARTSEAQGAQESVQLAHSIPAIPARASAQPLNAASATTAGAERAPVAPAQSVTHSVNSLLRQTDALENHFLQLDFERFSERSKGAAYFSGPMKKSNGPKRASLDDLQRAVKHIDARIYLHALEVQAVPQPVTVAQFRNASEIICEKLSSEVHLADEEMHLIELVGLLFEYVLIDELLPASVKAVLSYLHIPYLKVAFRERAWFSDVNHPARLLLDSLTRAGQLWVDGDGNSPYKVFSKIKQTVRHIVAAEEPSSELLSELLADFSAFSARVENNIDVVSKRAADKAEAEERLRAVKQSVLEQVQQVVRQRDLPAAVYVLIMHPWRDYLTYLALRHGVAHEQFTRELALIDRVIWSIEPKSSIEERNQLLFEQDDIQQRLELGLHTIAYAQPKTNKLIDALHQAQVLALRNVAIEPMASQARQELEQQAVSDVDLGQTPALLPAEQYVLAQLAQLPADAEFKLSTSEGVMIVRLAWQHAKNQQYLLVDRAGKPLPMMSAKQLARHMLEQQLTVIPKPKRSFIESALQVVLRMLGLD